MLSRLPELAKILRIVFVSEKKRYFAGRVCHRKSQQKL